MASARFAWGIDIGNRALKAIRLSRVGDHLKIDDYDVIEHEQILSNAGDNRDSYIQSSLTNFVQRHNLKGGVVSVGVSGQASFARFIKLPPVEKKQIPNIVRFEAIQQIPFPLEDVEWSYQLFEAPESPDVEVGIFAMRKELVARHMQFFTELDMKVGVVQMNPLAVYNAMQHDGRLGETTMIIDMGAENTDLIIADNNSVWLRSIPIGGNSFTEALVKAFKLNFPKAEELKRTAGTSKYTRQIFQAMRPIFGDLVGEIQRSMGFFSSVRRETRIKRIIALGSTFRLPNLLRYLQQNLQLEVERVDSLRAGAPADSKMAAGYSENMLSLVGAYGLALQAMGEGKIQSSLLPEVIRRERMWKEKTKWFATAAGLMLAGTGIAYGSIYLARTGEGSPAAAKNDQVLRRANDLSGRWAAVESSGSADRELIKSVYDLADYRTLWPVMLQELRAAVPPPQAEVAEGLAGWDAKKVKQVPRNERRLIQVQEIQSQYVPNLNQALNDPGFRNYAAGSAGTTGGRRSSPGGMPPGGFPGMPQMDPAEGQGGVTEPVRGYLITMRCITPYKDGYRFVQESLVKNLQKIHNDKSGHTFMVARAEITDAAPLANNPILLDQIRAAYSVLRGDPKEIASLRGSSRSMRGSAVPQGVYGGQEFPPEAAAEAYVPEWGARAPAGRGRTPANVSQKVLDPLTEEEVGSDSLVTVLAAVVIDPPPSLLPKPSQTAEPTDEAGGVNQ